MRRERRNRGFTLVEIMLVVVIIGILAGVVLPNLIGQRDKAQIAKAKAQIKAFELAMENYYMDFGEFPETLDDLVRSNGDDRWERPYIKKRVVPKDPWGQEYEYDPDGTNGIDYDLFTVGKDGQEGTEDDITNWDEDTEI